MGVQEVYRHKVQYYETDQMGIVHHSNYIRWFEEARTDYMERMGLGYDRMEAEGILSPVLSVEADYLRMVHFGDTVSITCSIKSYNGIKLFIGYEVILNQAVTIQRDTINYNAVIYEGIKNSKAVPAAIRRSALLGLIRSAGDRGVQ